MGLLWGRQMDKPVYIGDYGRVDIPKAWLVAYGIPKWPINRSSSKQRKAWDRLMLNLKHVQEHEWIVDKDGAA